MWTSKQSPVGDAWLVGGIKVGGGGGGGGGWGLASHSGMMLSRGLQVDSLCLSLSGLVSRSI